METYHAEKKRQKGLPDVPEAEDSQSDNKTEVKCMLRIHSRCTLLLQFEHSVFALVLFQ